MKVASSDADYSERAVLSLNEASKRLHVVMATLEHDGWTRTEIATLLHALVVGEVFGS